MKKLIKILFFLTILYFIFLIYYGSGDQEFTIKNLSEIETITIDSKWLTTGRAKVQIKGNLDCAVTLHWAEVHSINLLKGKIDTLILVDWYASPQVVKVIPQVPCGDESNLKIRFMFGHLGI
ncbi:MAG: hypothetical protein R2798_14375 [Chitinophagales bacterium]|nr:hypothetical protein [Bacteroidota bacterium]MCB9043476.1 hypothetical protein [Chitinophagales bacterium]